MEMRLDKRGSTAQLARQNAKSSRLDEPRAFEYFVGGTTVIYVTAFQLPRFREVSSPVI